MTQPVGHSPLGASGMARWSVCPASVPLSIGVKDTAGVYALEGTAAHELGERCLNAGQDAWEWIGGDKLDAGVEVTKDMADAVQVYLDAVRLRHPDRDQGNSWVERSFHAAGIHESMYGTSDLTVYNQGQRKLDVWDYKHGAGIVVDVQENPQLMYYGVGMLEDLDLWGKVETVTLHIAQPRGWHQGGPIRSWSVSTSDLDAWLTDVLLPAMEDALLASSEDTVSGEHCRFCPARKMACPQLAADMDELEDMMIEIDKRGGAEELSNERIGQFLDLHNRSKIVASAANDVAFHRLNAGTDIPGYKLVMSRTNRSWKDGAEEAVADALGDSAYEPLKMKSPAKIEKLAKGTAFADEWSLKSEGSLTVAPEKDKRAAIDRDVSGLFEPVKEKK